MDGPTHTKGRYPTAHSPLGLAPLALCRLLRCVPPSAKLQHSTHSTSASALTPDTNSVLDGFSAGLEPPQSVQSTWPLAAGPGILDAGLACAAAAGLGLDAGDAA